MKKFPILSKIKSLNDSIPLLERKVITGTANNSGAVSLGLSTGAYDVLTCFIDGISSAWIETQKYNRTWFAVNLTPGQQYSLIVVTWYIGT